MRIAIIGAGELGLTTAQFLLDRNHEVIMVEKDRSVIDELSEDISCSLLHGDGSRPSILEELGPRETDVLMCLTNEDLVNILASVTGKTLGFARVVTKIKNSEYTDVCAKLELDQIIVPNQTIGRYLADMVEGQDILELSTIIKGGARFFSFIVSKEEAGSRIGDLGLPEKTRAIFLYREDEFHLAEDRDKLKKGDDVVILTDRSHLQELIERWRPQSTGEAGTSGGES
ncbi:MAG: potassium channel family protein [Phycisphaerae bacterium]